MDDVFKLVGMILVFAALATGAVALSALVIWVLWNALVPALITNGPTISYFQAVLVNFVLAIVSGLFKGATK